MAIITSNKPMVAIEDRYLLTFMQSYQTFLRQKQKIMSRITQKSPLSAHHITP